MIEQLTDHLADQLDRVELTMQRFMLKSDLPELTKDESWQKVKRRVFQLSNLQGYRDEDGTPRTDKLVRDAYRLELGDATEQARKSDLLRRSSVQAQGQPSGDSAGEELPAVAMDTDDQLMEGIRQLQQGKDPDEVAEALRTARRPAPAVP